MIKEFSEEIKSGAKNNNSKDFNELLKLNDTKYTIQDKDSGSDFDKLIESKDPMQDNVDDYNIVNNVEAEYKDSILNLKQSLEFEKNKNNKLGESFDNIKQNLSETSEEIDLLEFQGKLLLPIQIIIDKIALLLNAKSIKLKTLTDIKDELNQLSLQMKVFEDIKHRLHNQMDLTTKKIDLTKIEIKNSYNQQEYFESHLKNKINYIDKYTQEHNLSEDDIDTINEFKSDLILKLKNIDSIDNKDIDEFNYEMDKFIIQSIEKLKEEIDDFDPDVKAIFISSATDAGLGAAFGSLGGGVGALPSAGIGAFTGACSELANQVAKHYGASNNEADIIQMVTGVVSAGGLVNLGGKLASKGLVKVDFSNLDNLSSSAINSRVGREFVKNIDNVIPIKTLNDKLAGLSHPVTNIKFNKEIVATPIGKIEAVFPKFDSKFDFNMPKEYFNKQGFVEISEQKQFKIFLESLSNKINTDVNLKSKFSLKQIKMIDSGILPKEYTIHHHQSIGKYQLIDSKIHNATAHTGGGKLWTTRHT